MSAFLDHQHRLILGIAYGLEADKILFVVMVSTVVFEVALCQDRETAYCVTRSVVVHGNCFSV